jgi:hypothetical protein
MRISESPQSIMATLVNKRKKTISETLEEEIKHVDTTGNEKQKKKY